MATPIRHVLIASMFCALAHGGAAAQDARHTPLTQQQIDNLIAVEEEIAPVMAKRPKTDDGALERALGPIEKKHGFPSDDEFAAVMTSVQLVMGGMNSQRKTYVGPDRLKGLIAVLEADRTLPEAQRSGALKTLRNQLKDVIAAGAPPPGNIELVVKNYDRLHRAMDRLAGDD